MQRIYFQFFIFLFFGVSSAFAQKQVKLLQSDSEQPIQYANIHWKSIANSSEHGFVSSDKNGNFTIPLNENKFILSITCVGYKAFLDSVNFATTETIYLERDMLNLDQVVVTGTRTQKRLANVPVQTMVISKAEIKQAGSVSTMETLQDYIPGIVTTPNAMGNNMRIKGLNSRYILFLVDGERMVSEGAGGNINLDQIDFNNIERIEVVNGAASALYGSNAVGAVINIITKRPIHKFEAGANMSYQSNNTQKYQVDVGANRDKFTSRANIFRNSSDGFDIENGPYAARYTDYGTDLKFGYNLTGRLKANLTGRFFQHETFNPDNSMDVEHDLDRKLTLGANATSLSKDAYNNLKVSVSFDKYYTYDVMEKKNDVLEEASNATYISSRVVDNYSSGETWEVVGGAEYNHEEISTITSITLGAEPTTKSVDDVNLFGQFQCTVVKDFDAIFGTRYTYNNQFKSSFNPKLSLMYKTSGFKFRGGLGTAFRAPSIKELYYDFDHRGMFWVNGNPDLKAEKGFYSSLSSEFTKSGFNASVSGYHNKIDNKITSYTIIDAEGKENRYYKNVSNATLKGFDFNLSYLFFNQLVLKGTYSYCDAQDDLTGLQLSSNVKHSGTVALTWNGKLAKSPFSLQLSGRMNSPKLYQSVSIDNYGNEITELEESDAYNIWKATLVKPFRINQHLLEVTAKCDNIFNFEESSFINPGRQYLIGLRYKFR